jgi:DNA-binding NarL/FixJ family response regulator
MKGVFHGETLIMFPTTVLVVDDYEPFRRYICTTLENPKFKVIGQASNGLAAVRGAEELRPDLILLDIGLPQLNGIEAARQISKFAPHSRIVFISQEESSDVVQAALSLGVSGYVHKSRIYADLLPAIESVLAGRRFVSASLEAAQATNDTIAQAPNRHEVLFYSEDATLIDGAARFIAPALTSGHLAIVVATASHRQDLARKLKKDGLNLEEAIQVGNYISLDAPLVLASIPVSGAPRQVQLVNMFTEIVKTASDTSNKRSPRIAIFGECVNLLCAEGNTNMAIEVERLWNGLLKTYENVDVLCGYQWSALPREEREGAYQSICKEHLAVYA